MTECDNFMNAKVNAFNACMSDELESDDSKDSKKENNVSFMSFPASVRGVGPSEVEPPILVETCDEGSLGDSDMELDLQKSYN
jgi:hypothetical protein